MFSTGHDLLKQDSGYNRNGPTEFTGHKSTKRLLMFFKHQSKDGVNNHELRIYHCDRFFSMEVFIFRPVRKF